MKKIILGMMAFAAILTACDPTVDRQSWSGDTVSAEELANGIVIKQYGGDKSGNDGVEKAGGNWIEFSTNPSKVVRVYYINKNGGESNLSVAKPNGLFYFRPSRGADPQVTLFFETREFDGSSVTVHKTITLDVAQELTKEMAIACSNSGEKVWKWNVDGKQVWGNFGYTPSDGATFASTLSAVWWGVDFISNNFTGQEAHRGTDKVVGDDDPGAYMIFSEDGTIKTYDKDGKEIRSGSFEINGYDETNRKVVNDQPWHIGILKTTPGTILWPYAINKNGYQPEEFQIIELSATDLVLTYADAGTGAWSEATFWRFHSDSDVAGQLSGYTADGTDWTWDTDFGAVWGNAGYHGGAPADWATSNAGQWWGVNFTTDLFAGQVEHRGTDKVTGDDEIDSYMTFFNDGTIKSFDPSGKEIRSGSWEIDMTPTSEFNIGTLKTSAGSILWPYAINKDGYQPTEFEVTYVSGNKLALVYAAPGTGAWSEATFWRFKKK